MNSQPSSVKAPSTHVIVITQSATFRDSNQESITRETYAGSTKEVYQLGFGRGLGIVTIQQGKAEYKKGCTVASFASARRGATVIFMATVGSRQATSAVQSGVSAATLRSGMNDVAELDIRFRNITAPFFIEVGEAVYSTVTTQAPPPPNEDSGVSSTSVTALAFAIALGCCCFGACVVLWCYEGVFMKKRPTRRDLDGPVVAASLDRRPPPA